jgi:hypothetical protein
MSDDDDIEDLQRELNRLRQMVYDAQSSGEVIPLGGFVKRILGEGSDLFHEIDVRKDAVKIREKISALEEWLSRYESNCASSSSHSDSASWDGEGTVCPRCKGTKVCTHAENSSISLLFVFWHL